MAMTNATKPYLQEVLRQTDADLAIVEQRLHGELRKKIADVRGRIRSFIVTDTVEQAETFDWQQQYAEAVTTLRRFGFAGDVVPAFEAIQGAFNAEKREAISGFREPALILVPNVSFEAKVRAIGASGIASRTCVNESVFGSVCKDEGQEQTTFWQPVVIESEQEMDTASFDDPSLTLRDRIDAVRGNCSAHVSGIDRDRYAILMMHALRKGKPIDCRTWTILDRDSALDGSTVPHGGWDVHRVRFDRCCVDDVSEGARFRFSVVGDVLGAQSL